MKKSLLVFYLLYISLLINSQNTNQTGTFEAGNKEFLLNGKPFLIRAGELHYPRIPKEYWEHRIQMCKAMGMNTICIYLFWNLHEQIPNQFDFTGQNDVAEFVRLVQKNGMYCIVRPGPYACAEWDMGGLPWWLLKKPGLQVRTRFDEYYIERVLLYFNEVGKQLAPLQIQNGGNIIMVQVENEYAVFGNDSIYMETLRDALKNSGFDKVQLFRCDWSSNFNKYHVPGVATTINFGAGANIEQQFKKFQEVYPEAPLMCSEYWTGWFDYWGRPHETRSVNSFIGSLKDMLDNNISFSLYMAHGGTSFGQWGGANSPPFGCMVASYDYNAPINEAGQPTEKFYAVLDLLKNYLNPGETIPDVPHSYPVISIPEINFTEKALLFENLPEVKISEKIQSMENFDQGWGRILYRTKLPDCKTTSKIKITELRDWAAIYINQELIGYLDRRKDENTIELPPVKTGDTLDILIEAMGRVNYGKTIIDRKGITDKVELLTNSVFINLLNWEVYNFPVDYQFQKNKKYTNTNQKAPAWYKAEFTLDETGDTYFDMSKWEKGMVWVNGYNIGRYWNIGPQQTLYMPGCWLNKGNNEIIILDLTGPEEQKVKGITEPILDKIVANESLFHRKPGDTLNLSNETPINTGTFNPGSGWKTISFDKKYKGRYLCFEAVNSHKPKDITSTISTIAELELITSDNTISPRTDWKIIYASSEETVAGNQTAEKIFDNQESTYWSSGWTASSDKQPHQIIIDLGKNTVIKGIRYLPFSNKKSNGFIKDYKIYLKNEPFTITHSN